jgi:hypothetical protein
MTTTYDIRDNNPVRKRAVTLYQFHKRAFFEVSSFGVATPGPVINSKSREVERTIRIIWRN